jgi:hypothetical protein
MITAPCQKCQRNDINAVLLEAIKKYEDENPQDKGTQLIDAKVQAVFNIKAGAPKKIVINQKPVAEGSRQQDAKKRSLINTLKQKGLKSKDEKVSREVCAVRQRSGNEQGSDKEVAQRNPKAGNGLKKIQPSKEEGVEKVIVGESIFAQFWMALMN